MTAEERAALVERALEVFAHAAGLGILPDDGDDWEEDFCNGMSAAIDLIRAEVLEEAARVAEREGVYPELNIAAGGPEWYRHGKRIAAAIRALKEKP